MSWQWTDLRYGWKIAAGITLAATTIYVASNTRERVNQADIIELALGTHERCLATQYSTNPVAYYVAPPSFVRSWYSNTYVTTNIPGDAVTNWTAVTYTNTFTNSIGFRTDRSMIAELDAKIKALVPYYCDPDTVYDGSTNITMLTVTGLWASLGIGDKTNQFTSVPEWVGTNGVTNAATYGTLPWRIYKTDLEERYKVLNALKCAVIGFVALSYSSERRGGTYLNTDGSIHTTWLAAKEDAVMYANSKTNYYIEDPGGGSICGWATEQPYLYDSGINGVYGYRGIWGEGIDHQADIFRATVTLGSFINTNLVLNEYYFIGGIGVSNVTMNLSKLNGFIDDWITPGSVSFETNYFGNTVIQDIADRPPNVVWTAPIGTIVGETNGIFGIAASGPTSVYHNTCSGYRLTLKPGKTLLPYAFHYCTNKYW